MAFITTDKDLKKMFSDLADHHEASRLALRKMVYPDLNPAVVAVKKGKGYLGKLWRQITIALLVNNRTKLAEYCRQAEIKILQELPALISQYNDKLTIKTTLLHYENRLQNYVVKIEHLPIVTKNISRSA